MDEHEKYLEPSETARLLHVDVSTLRKWYRGGRLAGVRVMTTQGGRRRYHARDIEALAEAQRTGDQLVTATSVSELVEAVSAPASAPVSMSMHAPARPLAPAQGYVQTSTLFSDPSMWKRDQGSVVTRRLQAIGCSWAASAALTIILWAVSLGHVEIETAARIGVVVVTALAFISLVVVAIAFRNPPSMRFKVMGKLVADPLAWILYSNLALAFCRAILK